MGMSWVEACREYAKKAGKYTIPKKGTPAYDEVRALMGSPAPAAAAEAPKKAGRPRKSQMDALEKKEEVAHKKESKVIEKVVEAHKEEGKAMKAEAKAKRVRTEKKPREGPKAKAERKVRAKVEHVPLPGMSADVKSSNAVEAKPKIVRRRASAKAGSVEAGGATEKAVAHSKNPSAVLESATNAHLPIVPKEAMVQVEVVKKRHLPSPALPSLVDKEAPVSAVPFSFQALRDQLGA